MAIKKILNAQDPRLRQVSKPVEKIDKRVIKLIRDLKDTLEAQKDPQGVGLAAPQIGVSLRVFVMRYKGKILPIINPEIVKVSERSNDPTEKPKNRKLETGNRKPETEYIMEGCLSLPHYYGPVRRAWEVELKYTKPDGQERVEKFKGFPAQIVQHEVDHLNGKIFIDRLFSQKRQLYQLQKGHWQEVDLP